MQSERLQRPPLVALPVSRTAPTILADALHRLQTGFCPAKRKGDFHCF